MRIVTLIENSSLSDDLIAEHGLSLYIETKSQKILFDAGQSDAFADNAEKLGVDLSAVDFAVLSHGHYDHSGGLARFLQINSKAPIYLSKYALSPCYHGSERYIGIDPALQNSDRLIFTDETHDLGTHMQLFGCNKKERSHPIDSSGLTVLQDGAYIDDQFLHEQYLLIEENSKRILISGCSHKGIQNIAAWFTPDVLIGGFHFMNLDPTSDDAVRLETAAHQLLTYATTYYTGHCTGPAQFDYMKTIMGERLHAIHSGSEIIL